MCQSKSYNSSHSPDPTCYPYVCSLHQCSLYLCQPTPVFLPGNPMDRGT